MTAVWDDVIEADVVVVGAGVAGLTTALGLPGLSVKVLSKGVLGDGASAWAQGGLAAAAGAGDSPAQHAADTLRVAGELADGRAVAALTREAPARVADLVAWGVRFERDPGGAFALGREAGHGRRRILHAGGDATGRELIRGLVDQVRDREGVDVVEHAEAERLVHAGGRVTGLVVRDGDERRVLLAARAVVLATGGIGQVYRHTTNPPGACGDGLALAAQAGARLADLEFVQFHPTALAVPGVAAMPLVTEALRGEGARLIDADGRRFMRHVHPDAELAPRDIVARALWTQLNAGRRVFLDLAPVDDLAERFPTVVGLCRRHGVDPFRPVPVAPAAHYHMGGVASDLRGRTSLQGLWAAGEVACTGAHGANRLASNSLLEAVVFGTRIARDLASNLPPRWGAPASVPGVPGTRLPDPALVAEVRGLLWDCVGLVRDGAGLAGALQRLEELAGDDAAPQGQVLVGRLIATAALRRRESRGAHYRRDYPARSPAQRHRRVLTVADVAQPALQTAS